MARFDNTYGISNLHMHGIKRKFFCPVGQSECTYEIEIDMEPRKVICDYLEVDTFIRDMDSNATLEACCATICDYMAKEYQPHAVMVKVKCDDARHMPAEVIKMVRRDMSGEYK